MLAVGLPGQGLRLATEDGEAVIGVNWLDSVFALEPFPLLGRIIGIITPGGIGQELYLQLRSRPIICSLLGWLHHQIAPLWPVKKPDNGKYVVAAGVQGGSGRPVKVGGG